MLFRESVRSRQSGAPNSSSLSTATRMTNSSAENIYGLSGNLVFTVKFDNIVAHTVWSSEFIKRLFFFEFRDPYTLRYLYTHLVRPKLKYVYGVYSMTCKPIVNASIIVLFSVFWNVFSF
jgi:hypothetical protein